MPCAHLPPISSTLFSPVGFSAFSSSPRASSWFSLLSSPLPFPGLTLSCLPPPGHLSSQLDSTSPVISDLFHRPAFGLLPGHCISFHPLSSSLCFLLPGLCSLAQSCSALPPPVAPTLHLGGCHMDLWEAAILHTPLSMTLFVNILLLYLFRRAASSPPQLKPSTGPWVTTASGTS